MREQKIFVNYYDYAALIPTARSTAKNAQTAYSPPQSRSFVHAEESTNGLKNNKQKGGGRASFKKRLPTLSDRKQQNKERVVLWLPASSFTQNQTKKDRRC